MSEKLIFPIGFDLEEGVTQVEKDWGVVQRRLQKTIDGKPLTIKVDSKGLEQFETYSDNMRNSINKIREAMKELDKTWNNMSDFEKFDEGGELTSGAQDLVQKYNELTVALQTYGKTLGQIASDAKHAAEEEVKALERKEQAQIKANRAAYDAQVRAGQQAITEQEKNRADYERLVADYAKREKAEERLTQRGLQYEQERIRLKQQAQQASDKEYENLVRQIKAEQQLASNQANRARQASYNAARKQGLERMRILNAEEKSIDAINRKLQIQQQRLQSTDMGSAKFQKIAAEVKRLTEELDKANARVAQLTGRATQGADQHTRAVERTNAAYKTQSSYLQRLAQRMIAYASVTQVFSFIRNIREVTAQFELQRVALGSIIGDLNEANAMFEQIKAAAVKSPFQIKELVTYTKQLAAYKIETDELFETTQRLADISAGLGVGMERLVLAYGQIRATGYLRASEVRQLTEAGIPIIEELAKKMSDLRGETVSAAEVMGMISERAISFGMVKEVFDDMTSAGGMFYKMQEKQAETLAGQISNLKDSFAIMYDEIGRSEYVNSKIKAMIGLVKSLAENWRDVYSVAQSLSVAMGVYYVTMKNATIASKALSVAEATRLSTLRATTIYMPKFLASTKLAITLTRAYRVAVIKSATATGLLSKAFWRLTKAMLSNPYTAVLAALAGLATLLLTTESRAKRLNKELAKIGTEGALQADQSVRNFERLAKSIRESANGSEKQTKALAEMKRAYGDFLPSQDKSIINLVREKDGYNAVTQAIREKIALQIQEQKLNSVTNEYGNILGKFQGKVRENLEKDGWSRDTISAIFEAIENEVKEGTLDISNVAQKLPEIFEQITGESLNYLQILTKSGSNFWGTPYLLEYLRNLNIYEDKLKDIISESEESVGVFGKYTQAYKNFKEELKDVTGTGEKFSFEWNESKTKSEIKAYNEFIGDLLAKEGIKFDIGEAIDFKGLYEALGDNYPQLKQVVAKIQKEYEKLVPKDLEKLIKEQFSTLATKYGASLDKLQHYFKSADQSTQDWVKTLKDAKTELGNQIFDAKKLDKDTTALEAQKQVIEAMITAWVNSEKTQKAGAKSAEQALKDELAAVEKIYKRYQDLRKLKSESDTQSILAKEFKGVSLTTLSKAYSPKQMLVVYQKALAEAQRLGKKDLVLEIQTKIGEFNVAEEQRNLEKNLKDLSDRISRTKTAKEFFDRMLGLTGDKQLSATLTMSVYGDDADVMGGLLAQQTANAFKKKYKDIDFSDVAISDKGIFDWETILMEGTEQFDKFGEQGWLDFLKDVQAAQDASAKRLETLMNELEKTKTYSEKLVDIYTNTQERLNTIDQEVEDDAVRKRLKEQVKTLQAKEIQKLQYESFKDSPMYVAMFENLDATSTAMLTNMRNHIVKLQSEWQKLDPTQLKELQSRINEIDKQLATRNPFKSIVDGIKEVNALQKSGSRKEDEQALFEATKKKVQAEKEYAQAVADGKSEAEIQRLAEALQKCVDNEKKAAEQMTKWDNATQKVMQGMQNLQQITQLVQTTTTAVNDIVEAFGGWGDAADEEFWNTILDGINRFMSGVQSAGTGVAQIMAGDILGGATSLISGIGSIVSSIGNLIYAGRIKRANEEIERQRELIDNLEYSYERLQKAQEKAFGSDYISNYEQRLANLQAQQEAYLKQADSERSKGKKADSGKIEEYEEAYREATDNIKDMQGELSEYFLGTDLTSAARDFANAWIDAYKEFGSTTDAMKEKFQDMIQNMIVESFAAKVIQSALSDIFTDIDNMTKDGVLDMSEASKIADMTEVAVGNIDVGMTNLMNALSQAGISVRGMGSDLTGISRDIATASEESILGLAAGINTQNFYISQVPTKLDTIIGLLRGENAMQGSAITLQDLVTIQNQHLSYLPSIAQHTAETVAECKQIVAETRRTADALDRVIKPEGTRTTYKMNVVTTYQG